MFTLYMGPAKVSEKLAIAVIGEKTILNPAFDHPVLSTQQPACNSVNISERLCFSPGEILAAAAMQQPAITGASVVFVLYLILSLCNQKGRHRGQQDVKNAVVLFPRPRKRERERERERQR
jgi:hypothetical protein